jgi:hypothetical protein
MVKGKKEVVARDFVEEEETLVYANIDSCT